MANEYVTQAELKGYVGIPVSDTVDDTLIDAAREAASRAIDGYCRRRFYKDTSATARRFRSSSAEVLEIPDFWDTASLVVETDDNADGTFETTWASTDYQVEPLNADALARPWHTIVAIDRYIWPTEGLRARIRITAKWGWSAVPADVKQACYLQASRAFKRKDSPFGVAGSNDQLGEIRMLAARLDPDVMVLLDPYSGRNDPTTVRIG